MAETRHWVNTVSLTHVNAGMAGGFTQAGHGAARRLRQLTLGDGLVFYSPRTSYPAGEPLQQFTALAVITGEAPYQVTVNPDFRPWRTAVRYLPVRPVAARSLIHELSFITDPQRWGLPFRRGLFAIPAEDFRRIAAAMQP